MSEEVETMKKIHLKKEDYIGKRFNKLTVLEFDHYGPRSTAFFKCRCDCGSECIVSLAGLRTGNNKSCGCMWKSNLKTNFPKYRKDQTTHGESNSRLYKIYTGMKSRCFNPNEPNYKRYGSRGITMCDEWMGENGFEQFRDWALANGYTDELSIERIDNDGDYEPSNCRWATVKEQARNRSNTLYVDYNGQKMPLVQVCEIEGVPYETMRRRIWKQGMDLDTALHTEIIHGRKPRNV